MADQGSGETQISRRAGASKDVPMPEPIRDKAAEYLASAKAAAGRAATENDPQLRASFEGIARVYGEMAERARKLDEDETMQR